MSNKAEDEDVDSTSNPQGVQLEVYSSNDSRPIGSVRFPKDCPPSNCKTVRISLVSIMVISAIVPFIIITCMHISYALTCPSQYTAGRAAGMITLNILCILPFISWFSFVTLFIWLVIMFVRRAQDSKCSEMMKSMHDSILHNRQTHTEDASFMRGKTKTKSPTPPKKDTSGTDSSQSSRSIQLESNSSHLSSLLDESSQMAVSESSTSMPDQDGATTSSFDSSFSESSLNEFTPNWRSPI